MRLAEGPKHFHPMTGCHCGSLTRHPALADTRRTHHTHDTAATIYRALRHGGDSGHLPTPTDQRRFRTPDEGTSRLDRISRRAHRFVGALDVHQLDVFEHRGTFDQSSRGFAEHHPTRWGDRLHPLSHSHLLADRGVTESP